MIYRLDTLKMSLQDVGLNNAELDLDVLFQTNYTITLIYNYLGVEDSSTLYINRCKELADKIDNVHTYAIYHYTAASSHLSFGHYVEAIKSYSKSQAYFESSDDESRKQHYIDCKNNSAYCYEMLGNYSKALQMYSSSKLDYMAINDTLSLMATNISLGSVYEKMNADQEAKEHLTIAKDYFERIGQNYEIAEALTKIAKIELKKGDTIQAISTLEKSLTHLEGINYAWEKSLVLNQIIRVLIETRQLDYARTKLTESSEVLNDFSNSRLESETLYLSGLIHLGKNAIDSALVQFKKSLAISSKHNYLLEQVEVLEQLVNILEEKDTKQVFAYQSKLLALKNLQIQQLKTNEIENAANKIDLLEKSEAVDLLTTLNEEGGKKLSEIQTQNARIKRWMTATIILALILIAAAIFIIKLIRDRGNAVYEKYNNQQQSIGLLKQAHETELSGLKRELQLLTQNMQLKNKENAMANNENSGQGTSKKIPKGLTSKSILTQNDWKKFRDLFEEINPGFFMRLKQHHPDLTEAEKRFAALIRMKMTLKEIGDVLGISSESARVSIYRMRKKMGIDSSSQLRTWIQGL
jgi:DNA-binding CsgD family transcriptional regulator